MSKKKAQGHDELEAVEHALTTSEAFIEKYQKQILVGVLAVVLIVLAVLAFRNFYLEPRETAADEEMFTAQNYFAEESFQLALDGDVDFKGFKEIASEYSSTKAGNLATAYAGICYYKLGEYENAINYLTQFDGDDTYLTMEVIGLTGDSYVELNDVSKAIGYFTKVTNMDNAVLSPIYLKKLGIAHESLDQLDKAEKAYQTIKEKYPQSQEAADIDKYISRLQYK